VQQPEKVGRNVT